MNKKIAQSAETRRTLHTHTHTHTCNLLLSPKQIGTICFAIFSILISAPLFATDIPSSASTADCKNNPLDTYSGTSNLQADWRANEIALHWYDGDTELTVAEESQTCTYDGTLTPPTTIPTKTGYTFKGWRVKQAAQCSLSGLDPSIGTDWDATLTRWKPISSPGYTMASAFDIENSSDLNPGEWVVTFSYGTVKGMAKCSAKSGNNNNYTFSNASSNWLATESELTSASGETKYCWCHATNYTPNGGNQCNVASPSWVFIYRNSSAYSCAKSCASDCALNVWDVPAFRRAVFGVSQ